MVSPRVSAALILAFALIVPSASATMLLPLEQPEALAPWGLDQRQAMGAGGSADLDLDIARQALILSAAGDVDGDGAADLIRQTLDLQNGQAVLQAVPGSDLTAPIWTMTPDPGAIPQIVGDLDADGVVDIVLANAALSGSGELQGAAGATAGSVSTQGKLIFQTLSGAAAAQGFDVELDAATEVTTAGVDLVGMAAPAGQHIEETTGTVQATGADALHQVEQHIETTQATLLSMLPIGGLTSVEADTVITVLDATGQVRGTISSEEPGVNPLQLAAPDLDADGLADTVLVEVQKVSPAQEASAIVPTISSYTGAAVSLAWEVSMDPLTGIPLVVPDVGDLNGDGVLELAYHGIDAVPGGDSSGTALAILDGASGEILAQTEAASGLLVAAPLGGDITGDAQAELMLLSGSVDAITHVAIASADLDTIWEADIPAGSAPLNLITDPFTGAVKGLSDLTGDGVPDLAIASGIAAAPLAGEVTAQASSGAFSLKVLSGVDGSTVWSTTEDAVLAVQSVPGLVQGQAQAGIALVVAESGKALDNGLQKADQVTLLLQQAADGAGILRLPLIEADVLASLGDDVAFVAEVTAAGDLDADGVEDLLVRVEAVVADTAKTTLHQVDGHAIAASDQAFDQVYAVSGLTGEVLDQEIAISADLQAELGLEGALPLGALEILEAYAGQSSNGGSLDTPGIGPALMIVSAVALAFIVRRRTL